MKNYMKTIVSAIKSWTIDKISSTKKQLDERIYNSKADWSQNNPEVDSYIKNRTHWTDDPVEVEILPETTIDINLDDTPYIEASDLPFVANQEYVVNWNGAQYNCKAYYTSDGGVAVGNGDLFVFGNDGGKGNGEPFFYASYVGDFGAIFTAESGTYTISIKTIDTPIHQLDPKYIKDMYHEYLAPNNDEVIWEQTITTEENYSFIGRDNIGLECFLTEGATYIVTWNDQTYTCTARYDSWGNLYIGNQAIAIEADGWEFLESIESNEPFFFFTFEEENDWYLIVQTAGEYTISVYGTGEKLTPYKIDYKYMPDRVVDDLRYYNDEINNIYNNISSVRTTANTANTTANNALTKANNAQSTANTAKTNAATAQSTANTAQSTANNALTTDAARMSIPFINCADIAYGNGKFVVVRDSNVVAYSEDGINWIQISIPFNGGASIAYGNGKFVVVNGYKSNTAAYSEDGVNWTQTILPSTDNWYHITCGDSKFVAIGGEYQSSAAAYSEDGVNWTQTTMPSSQMWTGITYGNGKFVAISSSSNIAAYSEDGVNWTRTTMPSIGGWRVVTYGGGKFVAVCTSTSDIAAYSEDGINWIQTIMPLKNTWGCIIYKNGKFIVISAESNIACSKDGINWTNTYEVISQNGNDVTDAVKEIILKDVNERIDALHSPQPFFTLTDSTTNYEYIIRMQNGNITSTCKASSLAVTTLPTKVSYTVGETLDLTDMVVTLTRQDGSTEEVNNYTYTEPDMSAAGTVEITVSYVEAGETYSAVFSVTVSEATSASETTTEEAAE